MENKIQFSSKLDVILGLIGAGKTIAVYEINSNINNGWPELKNISTKIKKEYELDIDNFHHVNPSIEDDSNKGLELKNKLEDVSGKLSTLESVILCKKDEIKSTKIMMVVTTSSICNSSKVDQIIGDLIENNRKSRTCDNIKIKNVGQFLVENNFDQNLDILNEINNEIIAKEISSMLKVDINKKKENRISFDTINLPAPSQIFHLKKYLVKENEKSIDLINTNDKYDFLVEKDDIFPLIINSLHGFSICRSNLPNFISNFSAFNNPKNQNLTPEKISSIKKEKILDLSESIKNKNKKLNISCNEEFIRYSTHMNDNHLNDGNIEILNNYKIIKWYCDF